MQTELAQLLGTAAGFERLLGAVVERSQDAIVLFDELPDRTVRAWNPGAEAMFGYSRDEIVGRSLNTLLPDDATRRAELEQVAIDLASKGHARLSESVRRRKDGEPVWVDVSYTAVSAPDGDILGVWAIYRDVTERRRLEDRLQAERLSLISNLAARLAHEIRNPLNTIVLNLDIVRDYLEEERRTGATHAAERHEILGATNSQVRRIEQVIHDYLGFARLTEPHLDAVDLDAMIKRNIAPLHPELSDRRIELTLSLEARGANVAVDEAQLWQALVRLIRNAIEAMPRGGTLTIATRAADGRVACEIRDTGVGMTADVRAHVFRPFFSTKPGGTGLGIALAQQIVRGHRAHLECRSVPRQGTCFTLVLPALDGQDATAAVAAEGLTRA